MYGVIIEPPIAIDPYEPPIAQPMYGVVIEPIDDPKFQPIYRVIVSE
jgi:hypothetical protein